MNTKNYLIMLAACLLALLVSNVLVKAQGPPRGGPGYGPPPERRDGRGPGQGRPFQPGNPPLGYFPFDPPANEQVVKGAPFSATATAEQLQVLNDGTRISNKTTATLYRDGEGRTRREMTLSVIGPFTVVGEPPQLAFINDFVAGMHYIVNVQRREVRKIKLGDLPPPPPPEAQGKIESLGKQVIEGLEAEGTRMTVTIPTGQIGNDRPIEIVTERWESTALKTVLLSTHRDPRVGETTYRLTNINRNEPARALFEVPSDYRILQGPPDGRPDGPPNGPPLGPPRGQGRRPGGEE